MIIYKVKQGEMSIHCQIVEELQVPAKPLYKK